MVPAYQTLIVDGAIIIAETACHGRNARTGCGLCRATPDTVISGREMSASRLWPGHHHSGVRTPLTFTGRRQDLQPMATSSSRS
jgi:hypothetical protein